MKKNIEILAPAGTMESLYAAVSNGANAIYLGGKTFGARAYAGNFGNGFRSDRFLRICVFSVSK